MFIYTQPSSAKFLAAGSLAIFAMLYSPNSLSNGEIMSCGCPATPAECQNMGSDETVVNGVSYEMPYICGTDGPDYLFGTRMPENICAYGGTDYVFGSGGMDCIEAGDGTDYVWAGRVMIRPRSPNYGSFIFGGSGTNYLTGNNGRDYIYGGSDTDYIRGRGRGDFINGGGGTDYSWGGQGNDNCINSTFQFSCENNTGF